MKQSSFSVMMAHWLAVLVGFLAARNAEANSANMRLCCVCCVSNELHLVVETYRTWMPVLADRPKTGDSKGYFIAVGLASEKPLAERTQIMGPLWETEDTEFPEGHYPEGHYLWEGDAGTLSPACKFDVDGTLLRFTRNRERKNVVCDALVLTPASAFWKRQCTVKPHAEVFAVTRDDCVLTASGKHVLLCLNGKAGCFNGFTGEPLDDPWLTERFVEARSIDKLNNVRFFLTEDLKYLVVSPYAIWADLRGRKFETFDFDGNTYRRADVGLVYRRPAAKPEIFRRTTEESVGFHVESPPAAFSIDGELYFFAYDKTMLRLYTPDGRKEITFKSTADLKLGCISAPKVFHAVNARELVMFEANETSEKGGKRLRMGLVLWNYEKNLVRRTEVPSSDLFIRRWGKLHPKCVVPVR